MNWQEKYYPESKFGKFTDIDGTIAFYARVNALLSANSVVLDVGCCRGAHQEDPVQFRKDLRNLRGKVRKVLGIDVDTAARENPFLDEFQLLEGDTWPVDDGTVDLILSDYLLEHLSDPQLFFSESRRVLREGGHLCCRTPNRRSYVALAARLIPNKHHARVASAVQTRRKEGDVFPTLYRCNTISVIKRYLKEYGFEGVVYGYEAEPSYLSFSKTAYFLGALYQRCVPEFLKSQIFAFANLKNDHQL